MATSAVQLQGDDVLGSQRLLVQECEASLEDTRKGPVDAWLTQRGTDIGPEEEDMQFPRLCGQLKGGHSKEKRGRP